MEETGLKVQATKQQGARDSLGPIEARLRLAAIVDSSDDAILSKDMHGIITSWNAGATKLFGYQAEEIVGTSILRLIPEELQMEEPEILRKVGAGERIEHFETQRLRKDGTRVDISLTISPVRDETGKIVGISKIARDITERRRTEEALVQSERLAALGRMAAAISHEVNNPLEAVVNLVYLLSINPSLDEEAKGYVDLLLQEVVRVGEITKQTLSFYRDVSDQEEVDLASMVEGVLKLTRSVIERKSVEVKTRLRRGVWVMGRAGELRQVMTNLLLNALDAVQEGGELRVRVSVFDGGRRACVTIADNGSGVPKELRGRLFEPFFSTKQAKGTGLGLWVSRSIVKKYGGTIALRTSDAAGRSGSVFRVCLPTR